MTTTYVRKDRRVYEDSHCLLCGTNYGICSGEHRAHPPTNCLACDTPQCWTNGMSRGQCSVCYVGLLPRFSRHKCGYAKCGKDAIAAAPRVKYVCADHAKTAKSNNRVIKNQTIAQYVKAQLIENRDKHWISIQFDMNQIAVLGARNV
jgi:hypothetical protein